MNIINLINVTSLVMILLRQFRHYLYLPIFVLYKKFSLIRTYVNNCLKIKKV